VRIVSLPKVALAKRPRGVDDGPRSMPGSQNYAIRRRVGAPNTHGQQSVPRLASWRCLRGRRPPLPSSYTSPRTTTYKL
jgi:hypothetical protein